jgi:CRISPR/Cas system CMR subunit Cmr6 (Cas7 group RAMP superfamily)
MYNKNRKMIDKVKNFKQFVNEDLNDIKQKYSIQNIERLWNSFSLKTRERISSGLDKNDIDVNKLFSEQSIEAQNEIVRKFKHAGTDVYIGWERDWK